MSCSSYASDAPGDSLRRQDDGGCCYILRGRRGPAAQVRNGRLISDDTFTRLAGFELPRPLPCSDEASIRKGCESKYFHLSCYAVMRTNFELGFH